MSDRYLCTEKAPWKPEYGGGVMHDDVEEIGDQIDGYPGGDLQKYRCKNCGHEWTAELPQ